MQLPWRRKLVPAVSAAFLLAVPAGAAGQDGSAAELDLVYTADMLANLSGGRTTGSALLGNLDFTAMADLGSLVGLEGTRAFVYVLGNHGEAPSRLVGDAQIVSNIQAPSAIRLYEAWIEKDFRDARLSLLAGLYDLNSEFDVLPSASLFLNSSFGIGAEFAASCVNGPSIFPVTSLGLRGKWRPTSSIYAQAAVLDGVAGDPSRPGATAVHLSSREGALIVAEVGWIARRPNDGADRPTQDHRAHGPVGRRVTGRGVRGKFAVGLWDYTRHARAVDPDLDGSRIAGSPGVYLLGEWTLLPQGDGGAQGLVLSGRIGLADSETNRYASYTGASAVYRGPIPGRAKDELGLGIAAAHDGDAFRRARRAEGRAAGRTETAIELTYRIHGDGWALQPDLQYVIQPNADPTLPNALLLGIRGELTVF